MDAQKPKEPLLAIMLTFILSGLGQLYAGKPKRGILFLTIQILVGLGLGLYAISPNTKTYLITLIPVVLLFAFGIFVVFDAYFCARNFNKANNLERKLSKGKRILLIFGVLFFLVGPNLGTPIAVYIRSNIIQAFRFPSGSMRPTIVEGDRLLTDKSIYKKSEPQRGDLIVFVYPPDDSRDFLKRLIAFGGETVEIKSGDVYVNGQLIMDLKIKDKYYYNRGEYGQEGNPVKVPEGHYYVLGDNSGSSSDSRFWGFVPEDNLIGKIYKIYWPPNRSGPIE